MNYIQKQDFNKEENMGNPIKVKYKFGQIEFEAEGDSIDVEKQRDYFMNAIIPVATTIVNKIPVIDRKNESLSREIEYVENNNNNLRINNSVRANLITFLKDFKDLSDRDFTLFAAFYHEQESGDSYIFTSEDVKEFFKEARRPASKNNSDILQRLVKAGLIMEADNPDNKTPKPYLITQEGIKYINEYKPKEKIDKKIKGTTNTKRKVNSVYSKLNADDLNLSKYPSIKNLKSAKEKIIMIMFIITEEKKGLWFLATDIEYILINALNIHVTLKQVKNLFDRDRDLFAKQKSEKNKKAYEYRLLMGAIDFAKELIEKNTSV